jgi:hypothetical protein
MKVQNLIFNFVVFHFFFLDMIFSACPNGGGNPLTAFDCYSKTQGTNPCCMISSPGYSPANRMCVEIPSSSYSGQRIYTYNNLTWSLDCGKVEVKVVAGGVCGNLNPTLGFDCWSFSTKDSSCCFYKNNLTNAPACQWLGDKKMGNATLNGYNLICGSSFLIFNSLILVFISFLFF